MALFKIVLYVLACALMAKANPIDFVYDILDGALSSLLSANICKGDDKPMTLSELSPTFTVRSADKNRDFFTITSETDIQKEVQKLASDGFFQKDRKVIFIVHGFQGKEKQKWPQQYAQALVAIEKDTVVLNAYWTKGSGAEQKGKLLELKDSYIKATVNTNTIAKAMASFAREIRKLPVYAANPPYMHCIGFSLGAHACGKLGREVQPAFKFDRITGLDPAGPNFRECPINDGIGRESGKCVDIIHTDAAKMGQIKALGHMDFYPNGGSHQPGCGITGFKVDCSHRRAIALFYLTIKERNACEANSCEVNEKDTKCVQKNAQKAAMGYFSSCHKSTASSAPTGASYFVKTDDGSNKCNGKSVDMSS